MINTDKRVIHDKLSLTDILKFVFLVTEGLLLVVWSSIGLWVVGWVGLWVQSFYFAMGWVGLKKLDPRTTLVYHFYLPAASDLELIGPTQAIKTHRGPIR